MSVIVVLSHRDRALYGDLSFIAEYVLTCDMRLGYPLHLHRRLKGYVFENIREPCNQDLISIVSTVTVCQLSSRVHYARLHARYRWLHLLTNDRRIWAPQDTKSTHSPITHTAKSILKEDIVAIIVTYSYGAFRALWVDTIEFRVIQQVFRTSLYHSM